MSERRFLYHAHGMALGGTITKPFQAEIDGQATTSLASIGGYSSTQAEKYTLNNIISYDSAHCYVSGVQTEDGVYHTAITSIVKGLNILHVVTADAVVAKVSSKHTLKGQPDISVLGSHFDNLKIGGQAVDVDLDHERYAKHLTYDALMEDSKKKTAPKLRYQWGLPSTKIPSGLEQGMLVPPEVGCYKSHGLLCTSMVKAVRPVSSGNSSEELPYGHAIHIPHVGNLYLAELYTTADSKRLRMLRLELGCPYTGMVAAVEGAANGSLG